MMNDEKDPSHRERGPLDLLLLKALLHRRFPGVAGNPAFLGS